MIKIALDMMGGDNAPSSNIGGVFEFLSENAVHGSDSDENALKEINFFFSGSELI